MPRQQLTEQDVEDAIEGIKNCLPLLMKRKGMGCFASSHEILGIINQETSEFEETIHKKMSSSAKVHELIDIAHACIWGIASIKAGGTDW